MSAYLVIGATGRQGGSTARELLKAGAKVHALVRNPESAAAKAIKDEGAILFKGDAGDAAAVTRALKGVSGVFFNPPDPAPDTLDIAKTFIDTCAKAGVEHFVLSSTAGTTQHVEALRTDPTYAERQKKFKGYWDLKAGTEQAAKEAGFKNLTIVRASLLYHIYLPGYNPVPGMEMFPALWTQRKFVTALKPGTKVPHILGEDVGKFAAAALLNPAKFAGKELDLAADNLTAQEFAGVVGDVTGVKIDAPAPEFAADGVQSVGLDSFALAGYHEWCNEFGAAVDTKALEEYGVEMTSMREFWKSHKGAIMEALSG